MTVGYVLEQVDYFPAPLPSALVLLGNLLILMTSGTFVRGRESQAAVNIIFFICNVLVFLYDLLVANDMYYDEAIYDSD